MKRSIWNSMFLMSDDTELYCKEVIVLSPDWFLKKCSETLSYNTGW